jgi:hypothetical protein
MSLYARLRTTWALLLYLHWKIDSEIIVFLGGGVFTDPRSNLTIINNHCKFLNKKVKHMKTPSHSLLCEAGGCSLVLLGSKTRFPPYSYTTQTLPADFFADWGTRSASLLFKNNNLQQRLCKSFFAAKATEPHSQRPKNINAFPRSSCATSLNVRQGWRLTVRDKRREHNNVRGS